MTEEVLGDAIALSKRIQASKVFGTHMKAAFELRTGYPANRVEGDDICTTTTSGPK